MPRALKLLLGLAVVALCVGGPVLLAFHWQGETRHFYVVRDGVLYRSGQNTLFGLKNLLHDYGIRTVVVLRDPPVPGQTDPAQKEEEYCLKEGIHYVRIPPHHWEDPEGGEPPVEEGVRTFRAVMSDPDNYPVLVHCFAGIHRTGAYCAIYRMEFEHWDNDRAIAELKTCGYTNLAEEGDILGYLQRYRPAWKKD
jgi:tyrosine-protein phosphatase SIW14